SRSPSRRRPRLFSRSRALPRAPAPAAAAAAAPPARRSSGPRARRHPPAPASTTAAATRTTRPAHERSAASGGRSTEQARPRHAGTPAGTAFDNSSWTWCAILPASPDNTGSALRCPRNRGKSINPSLAGLDSFIPLWALLIYVITNLGLVAYGVVLFVLML